jgi:hypothetical protein
VYNRPQLYDWMFAHTTLVPEPAALGLMLIAAMVLAGHRARKDKLSLRAGPSSAPICNTVAL